MNSHVRSQIVLSIEALFAMLTAVGFLSCMISHMYSKMVLFHEPLLTMLTAVGFLICMTSLECFRISLF